MPNTSAVVLAALVAWTLLLVVVMEGLRIRYLAAGVVTATALRPDNSNLPPFMQRLARAHANCVESFPVIGGTLIVALLANGTALTDPLAPWLLGARVVQSSLHVASGGTVTTNLRFAAFAAQVAIVAYWLWVLLAR